MTENDDQDEILLESLRRIAARVDPVPPAATQAAYAALDLRRLDEECAELILDSALVEVGRRAGEDGPRLLSFEWAAGSIELELRRGGNRVALRGLLIGVAGPVTVQAPSGQWPGRPDEGADRAGWFRVDDVPSGPLRVRVGAPPGRLTPWFAA